MQPARIADATAVLGQPKDWNVERDGPVAGLPVRREMLDRAHCLTSAWMPTPEEVQQLVFGGAVHLHVLGAGHPVVAITVGPPAQPLG